MKLTCKNCNHIYSGHYCCNCGQTAETHKLNFQFILHEIEYGLFHFDSYLNSRRDYYLLNEEVKINASLKQVNCTIININYTTFFFLNFIDMNPK
jgi:hypothetical protein